MTIYADKNSPTRTKDLLHSIGMEAYAENYGSLLRVMRYGNKDDITAVFTKSPKGWNEAGCILRANAVIPLFKEGRDIEALHLCSESRNKVAAIKANKILQDMDYNPMPWDMSRSSIYKNPNWLWEDEMTTETNESIDELWLQFNQYANKLAEALGRSKNIVGEYAEYIAYRMYGGELLNVSTASADIRTEEGTTYQVKARKSSIETTLLSVIRSWDFDYLVVILFDENGFLTKALQVPVKVAKEYGRFHKQMNGYVISTTKEFLNDPRSLDITSALSMAAEGPV